jgi:HpcH/HpaI aldolase/citrate lyase family
MHAPQLLLVAPSLELQRSAGTSVDAVMVDLEQRGKAQRQLGFDTQINRQSLANVRAAAACTAIPIVARINALSAHTAANIDRAIDAGASCIMLPMAKTVNDVVRFLRLLDGRAEAIVQVETPSLFGAAKALRELPWQRLYIGLNDLMVARGDGFLWQPLHSGSLEQFCADLAPRSVGFGGVTVVGAGTPIPTLELMAEMLRLNCDLTVLRRSFVRDSAIADAPVEIAKIRAAFTRLSEDAAQRGQLCQALQLRLRQLQISLRA